MTRIELTYGEDPLEITVSVEHPDSYTAKATAHELARHLLDPVPQTYMLDTNANTESVTP